MRTYFIKSYRREESEKIMNVLDKHEVAGAKRESSIMCFETIRFECTKDVWKVIKKELNLEIVSVFSKIKIEP